MTMEFLYILEDLRTPFWDQALSLITHLGSEIVFMVLAVAMYWCVSKAQGLYLLSVGCLGTTLNQFLKLACRVPRPWVRDPDFTIVEAARADATGYSFPSGHSTSSVGTFGVLATEGKRFWLRISSMVLCFLIPLTRLYLGVHTPADVLVGSAIPLFFIVVLRPAIYNADGKHIPKLLTAMSLLCAAFVLYMEYYPFPANVDADNLHSAVKNSYTLMGAMLGMIVVYQYDENHSFSTEAVWYAQLLKIVLGLALALAVKEGLKLPLESLFSGHMIARGIRYMALVLFAGIVWPMTFPLFQKLGRKDEA